jgi:hypothetical protein
MKRYILAALLVLAAGCAPSREQPGAPTVAAGPTAAPGDRGETAPRTPVVPQPGILSLDPATQSVAPAPPGSGDLLARLGVNMHFRNGPNDPGLRIAADTGFTWVRTDLTWRDLETQPGVYDFTRFDQIVAGAESFGMKTLFILDYGNAFHTGGPRMPPTTAEAIAAFGDYAEDVARHFAGHAVAYEIWNEPNTATFWPPEPDAQIYAKLADAAALHIRAGDPAAPVIVGGLSLFDFSFLHNMLAQPHAATYNAISVHPYIAQPERLPELASNMRQIIDDTLPYQPPIWISEWGYSSLCPAEAAGVVVCDRQPQLVARELLNAWAQGFPLIVDYELRDRDTATSTDPEGHFGLITLEGAAKPALAAVRTLASLARGHTYAGQIALANASLHAMRLDGADNTVVALWLDQGAEPVAVGVPPGTSGLDLLGDPLALEARGGQLVLSLRDSAGPVYLRFAPARSPQG